MSVNNTTYGFSIFNEQSSTGITSAIDNFNKTNKYPIIVCIGSDLVLGDSLGPLVGTLLKKRNLGAYVYGTLTQPITAKEVEYVKTYIKQMHPNSIVIAIDAAVGVSEEIGLLRVMGYGIKPGLGVNKNLSVIGDISIIGIVAEKSPKNFNLFNLTRLNLIYKMAEIVSDGITDYVKTISEKEKNSNYNFDNGNTSISSFIKIVKQNKSQNKKGA